MQKHYLVITLSFITGKKSLNNPRFFSIHPVLKGASDKSELSLDEMLKWHVERSDAEWEDRTKQCERYTENLNSKTKDKAIDYWKSELSAQKDDANLLAAQREAIGTSYTNLDPFTRDQGSDISTRAQALEDAAYTCKHKLTPKDIGLENPEWMKIRDERLQKEQEEKKEQDIKERDEYLALQQQSEPMDLSDPDG